MEYKEANSIDNLIQLHQHQYHQLSTRFQGQEVDPSMLLRFLIGAGGDADEATRKLEDSLQWRRQVGFDEMIQIYGDADCTEFPHYDIVTRFYPHNETFDINPISLNNISINRMGMIHASCFTRNVSIEMICEYQLAVIANKIARLNRLCQETGLLHREELIIDVKGLGLSLIQPSLLEYLNVLNSVLEANFPELVHKVYIVNVPKIFYAGWSVICGFINENTKNKVCILGTDWQQVLHDQVPEDILPDFLGGSSDKFFASSVEEHHDEVVIGSGRTWQWEIDAKDGDFISWDFRTDENRTVDFHVYHNGECVVKDQSLAPYVVHSGRFGCDEDGVVTLELTNRSWFSTTVFLNWQF